ncbi:hypothetical protein QYF36_017666 [Acer negundo]|nr:hypothetical protein QYF36_017666 [Acer negundo]
MNILCGATDADADRNVATHCVHGFPTRRAILAGITTSNYASRSYWEQALTKLSLSFQVELSTFKQPDLGILWVSTNLKIIGARYYNSASSEISARDEQDADILAAFDDAIADGVDLITISIGGSNAIEFNEDVIAIGAFHAMAKGILTVQSAGNDGPKSSSVSSVAPWLFSVAASSTDRMIVDNIILGNGKTVQGTSINSFSLDGQKLPLVHGKEVLSLTDDCSTTSAENCFPGCLDSRKVKGKIIICDREMGYVGALKAGAAGSILLTDLSKEEPFIVAFIVPLPASAVRSKEYNAILSYKNSTKY